MITRHAATTVLLLLALALPRAARGDTAAKENSFALDIHALAQVDDGGNPYQQEGFGYFAGAGEFQLKLSSRVRFFINGALGWIGNADRVNLPDTVSNAVTTSPTPDQLTLDSSMGLTIELGEARLWELRVATSYHHQKTFLTWGFDLGIARHLADGNTTLSLLYRGRYVSVNRPVWNNQRKALDYQIGSTFIFGWHQILSPSLSMDTVVQVVRQDGELANTLQYAALHRGTIPILLVGEKLPRTRHRGQVALRLRYSPRLGFATGLDLSGYVDDWGVVHGALEPSVEVPLGREVRLRLWQRVAIQGASEYFLPQMSGDAAPAFRTQDADLGSFTAISPGVSLDFPVTLLGIHDFSGRASAYGYLRSDGLRVGGSTMGLVKRW